MRVARTEGVMTGLRLHKSSILRKNGKSKIWLREEKKLQVTMHIFFSRQIQYKMLLLITAHPFWWWWADNLKHSKENYFPKKLTFQSNHSTCAWFQDRSTANSRKLFPFQTSHACLCFVYLVFLAKHWPRKKLFVFFTSPGSSKGDVHGTSICQLVCVSEKAFCSSFHAPTYLWKSILKTKPVFKAVTIFSFTALHFRWGRETLAKSRISSVKIIILADSSLSAFSWGFVRGFQGGWCSPSELFFQSSPRQPSLGTHPFSITRLRTQLSHSENVAVSNCVIRHGSMIYDGDANSLLFGRFVHNGMAGKDS